MLISLSIIFVLGILFNYIFEKINLPGLIGMILVGIIIGPFSLNLIDKSILNISEELRKIALIIILFRAGLTLNIKDLKKIGFRATLLSFVPATFEMLAVGFIAPLIFNISYLDSFILGAVLSAVSPAVIVPKMIDIIEEGYGNVKKIPSLILAGASVDDIYVIVVFTSLMSIHKGSTLNIMSFVNIPISIIIGSFVGIIIGLLTIYFFRKIGLGIVFKVILILSISFSFVYIERYIIMSGLISVMVYGITILRKNKELAFDLKDRFSVLWDIFKILLFVLIGMEFNISYASKNLFMAVIVIVFALIFRSLGVYLSLLGSNLNIKEKVFCIISYLPKATVQAAIASIPLSEGVISGEIILSVSIIAVLLTASIGAILIEKTYRRFL